MFRASAGWIADRDRLPTSVRAVLGYYADSGMFDLGSVRLKRRVDGVTAAMVEDAFDPVEAAIAEAFDRERVSFSYDTKLLLPAQLTLGYCYRRLDEDEHWRAEGMTRLAIEALLDGDMRDAINDDEFGDFRVDLPLSDEADRRRVATIAQETLEGRVRESFEAYPDAVEAAYDRAVAVSEAHQEEDERFRRLFAAARDGDTAARDRIRADYRDADFADEPGAFASDETRLPYAKTQYDRVGVIYDGMIDMYRAADLPVSEPFKRAVVLAIVGAQIWLDDVDDYRADVADGQLTPVTAEYLLASSDREARENVIDVAERYLDLAKTHARSADSPLTGIATEYIYRSGDPAVLPGNGRGGD